jgi:short-subunit dehydrogenase
MQFEAKKVVVVGGSAGMGRQVAIDVVDHGGSAVIVGRSKARVDDTVAELTSRGGHAWGIAAELTDRAVIVDVQRALSEQHADATLLVNAAGFFIPKPFIEYDEQFYDSYMDLNYALFFLTQTVVAGMVAGGQGCRAHSIKAFVALNAEVDNCRWRGCRSIFAWPMFKQNVTTGWGCSVSQRSASCLPHRRRAPYCNRSLPWWVGGH